VVLLLLACSTAGSAMRPELLRVGDAPAVRPEDLARCERLGKVQGVGIGGWGTTHDQQQYWARKEAENIASDMGATHVKVDWERDDPNALTVYGDAYRCAAGAP
jgi:hypothetical protein